MATSAHLRNPHVDHMRFVESRIAGERHIEDGMATCTRLGEAEGRKQLKAGPFPTMLCLQMAEGCPEEGRQASTMLPNHRVGSHHGGLSSKSSAHKSIHRPKRAHQRSVTGPGSSGSSCSAKGASANHSAQTPPHRSPCSTTRKRGLVHSWPRCFCSTCALDGALVGASAAHAMAS